MLAHASGGPREHSQQRGATVRTWCQGKPQGEQEVKGRSFVRLECRPQQGVVGNKTVARERKTLNGRLKRRKPLKEKWLVPLAVGLIGL